MSIIFSQRLKEERLQEGLTQKQMAERLEIPLSTYKNYEALGKGRREPDMEMIVKIATVLDTTTDYLMGKDAI